MQQVESKLIPIIREGIDVVKMIFFKKLKVYLAAKYPERDAPHINKLAGAIINDLFGSPNEEISFALFAAENKACIEAELLGVSKELSEMLIPLTDALRMQTLCDYQEGVDSSSVLVRAKELGILIADREAPLPAPFVSLVRRLGGAFHILNN